MSSEPQKESIAAETTTQSSSLLEQIVANAPKASRKPGFEKNVEELVRMSMDGVATHGKSVVETINNMIASIDAKLSKQLAAIMHAPEFQKLEGSWRGLHYLVMNTETCGTLKLRVLNVTRKELHKDLVNAVEFDQSETFKKLYTAEFDTPGGEPYGALIGDFEFTNHPEDMEILERMSQIAAAGFCPFLSAAAPQLFGMESFTELSKPRDLEKAFASADHIKWRSFRDSEDSRFVTLTMPRVLSRLPYGKLTKTIDEFDYEEVESDAQGNAKPVPHENYAWMNAAYVLGSRLTNAFSKTNWCTAIRGVENGGMVEGLPAHIFTTEDGDRDLKCPTEIGIAERRHAELSKLGFLPLCHWKNQDYAVFLGGQTTQKPKKYDKADATENAAISARLPYLMATGRIAHYLKAIARDKIGAFMERSDMEDFLKRWIARYICNDAKPDADTKARYPLAAAEISVTEVPGSPGAYNAVCHLRPWLQMEELTASLRMVTKIPAKK